MNSSSFTPDLAHSLKCELAGEVLRRNGKLRIRVNGWSMLPTIWPGDALIIDALNDGPVGVGQIVVFGRDGRLFIHRVVSEDVASSPATIQTRGDAMPQSDPPISTTALLGKVRTIVRNRCEIEAVANMKLPHRFVAACARNWEFAARFIIAAKCLQQKLQSAT